MASFVHVLNPLGVESLGQAEGAVDLSNDCRVVPELGHGFGQALPFKGVEVFAGGLLRVLQACATALCSHDYRRGIYLATEPRIEHKRLERRCSWTS